METNEPKWEINQRNINCIKGCEIGKITPCYFPFCENNLACKEDMTPAKDLRRIIKDDPDKLKQGKLKKPVDNMNSIKQYFDYQKEINLINTKKDKLENAQKELYNTIKTDIETVFFALDCDEVGTEIELTKKGIEINYPVRIFNDDSILYKINTDLFTQLNNLIGVHGKLNIENTRQYLGGNHVYMLKLIYELEE